MKKLSLVFVIVFAVLVLIPVSSQTVYAQLISKEEIVKSFDQMSAYFVSVAEAMPAEHYGFKPTPEMMSFAEQMNHVGGFGFIFAGRFLNKPSDKKMESTNKAQIVAGLKESFSHFKSALEDLDVDDYEAEVDLWGSKRTRFHAVLFWMDHMTHHKGYNLVYLRLNGITPPAGYVGW